jgi:hypothetical protein
MPYLYIPDFPHEFVENKRIWYTFERQNMSLSNKHIMSNIPDAAGLNCIIENNPVEPEMLYAVLNKQHQSKSNF